MEEFVACFAERACASVLMHKFVCRGTVEERIDALIASKKGLSEALLAGPGEVT